MLIYARKCSHSMSVLQVTGNHSLSTFERCCLIGISSHIHQVLRPQAKFRFPTRCRLCLERVGCHTHLYPVNESLKTISRIPTQPTAAMIDTWRLEVSIVIASIRVTLVDLLRVDEAA